MEGIKRKEVKSLLKKATNNAQSIGIEKHNLWRIERKIVSIRLEDRKKLKACKPLSEI